MITFLLTYLVEETRTDLSHASALVLFTSSIRGRVTNSGLVTDLYGHSANEMHHGRANLTTVLCPKILLIISHFTVTLLNSVLK